MANFLECLAPYRQLGFQDYTECSTTKLQMFHCKQSPKLSVIERYTSCQGSCQVSLARSVVVSRKELGRCTKGALSVPLNSHQSEKCGNLFSSLCIHTWTSYRTLIRVVKLLFKSVCSKNLGHWHFGRSPPLSYWLFCSLSCGMFSLLLAKIFHYGGKILVIRRAIFFQMYQIVAKTSSIYPQNPLVKISDHFSWRILTSFSVSVLASLWKRVTP